MEDIFEEQEREAYSAKMHELAMAMDHYSDDPENLAELEQPRQELLAEDPTNAATYMQNTPTLPLFFSLFLPKLPPV